MDFWSILTLTDIILFSIVSFTVLYLTVFTLTSMLYKRQHTQKARTQNRFIILILADGDDRVEDSVASALIQSYPQRLFDITVISNNCSEMTNLRLAQQPITLLTPNYESKEKTKSLQTAIYNLPQFKIYDVVLFLQGGDVIEPDFLERLNEKYEGSGSKVVQPHLISQNCHNHIAYMSAIFEEINNTIFRKGHNSIGLPASLCSSGMAMNYEWFKETLFSKKNAWDIKELESTLIQQRNYVEYLDDLYVFNPKTHRAEDFNQQRLQWMNSQFVSLFKNLYHLPIAILNRHYALSDKLIQWMLLPRIMMMAIICLMCVVMPFIYMSLALKWWALFTFVTFIFALATPDYIVDQERWDTFYYKAPLLIVKTVPGLSKVAKQIQRLESIISNKK